MLTEHRLDEAKEIGELRTKLALAEQTISWLRKKASTTASTGTEPTPVMLAPAPVALAPSEPVLITKTEDIPISEERLREYQQSKR